MSNPAHRQYSTYINSSDRTSQDWTNTIFEHLFAITVLIPDSPNTSYHDFTEQSTLLKCYSSNMATNRDGLKWVQESIWGKEPRWTKQPDVPTIERLARKHLNLGNAQSNRCDITFFAQGGFNKLYKIQTDARCWLMRVTLPVDPMNKTRCVKPSQTCLQFACAGQMLIWHQEWSWNYQLRPRQDRHSCPTDRGF